MSKIWVGIVLTKEWGFWLSNSEADIIWFPKNLIASEWEVWYTLIFSEGKGECLGHE